MARNNPENPNQETPPQSEPTPPPIPSEETKDSGDLVTVKNRKDFPIQLDFGRNQEVTVPAYGKKSFPKKFLEHPAYKKVSGHFIIIKGKA